MEDQTPKTKMTFFKAIAMISVFGFGAVGSMFLGLYLDEKFNSKPAITIILPTLLIITEWAIILKIVFNHKSAELKQALEENNESSSSK